ncbi:MAG: molybdate ABC transporter substrate-binding protein [Rudaea sp.]
MNVAMARNLARRAARIVPLALMLLCAATATARAEDLTVSAAASLTNAFGEIGKAYEVAHPGSHVVFNFAASDVLLKQIEQGAPADVFASADEATMDRAAAAAHVDASTRRDFAANTLVLIVPTTGATPARLADLKAESYKHIAIGNPDSVPAGRYARQALSEVGLWDGVQSKLVQAQNVRQALDYVARGEAEAGFVYATDAATQKANVTVALTVPTSTQVRYPIAALKSSPHAAQARAFIDFVLSSSAQATLRQYGFSSTKP